jgi:hypothetical protein
MRTDAQSFGHLSNRITALRNLLHSITFEIFTEFSFTHDRLLASLLEKKVSTILGSIYMNAELRQSQL